MDGPVDARRKGINEGMGIMDQGEYEIFLSVKMTLGERKLGCRRGQTFK
jgi:hypothetical protein